MSQLKNVVVTSSPHVKTADGTTSIMGDVIIALIPALVMSVLTFGFRTLSITAVCIISCILAELLFNFLNKQKPTITDLSAVVTGILLAYNVPVAAPLWICVIGSFFAIIVVKMLFGGIGQNFVNPALGARLFMFSWATIMTSFTKPNIDLPLFANPVLVDSMSSATPLQQLKSGFLPNASTAELLLGQIGGCIGEVSAVALIAGGLYLVFRKVITPTSPLAFIGTVFVIAFLFPQGNDPLQFALAHIFSGGLMLGAIFMATDYSTSPVTQKGQFIFGLGCGLLTMLIRNFGSLVEGVSYSIVLMNALVFLIDKYTLPTKFGATKKVRASKKTTETEASK